MHYTLFLGSTILLIGNANVVTGGLVQAVVGWPLGGVLWTLAVVIQNVIALGGAAGHRVLLQAPTRRSAGAPVTGPRRTAGPDVDHPGRLDGILRPRLRSGGLWRYHRRGRDQCHRRPAGGPRRPGERNVVRRLLVGAHRGPRDVPAVHPDQQALPRVHELREHLVPEARTTRRAAEDGPRGRDGDVRAQDAPGSRLEGRPRRVHLHRVRPVPGGVSRLQHREAAQPQALHHGHPRHVGDGRTDHRHHPELADRARDLRPGRHDPVARGDVGRHRRYGHPVRRRLGLRDVWRLRRRLSRPHRARGQDRGPPPQPGAGGEPVPDRADGRLPGHGEPGQSLGPAGVGPPRLDQATPVRCADGRGHGSRRPA